MAKKREYGVGKTVKDIITGISRNLNRVKESTLRSAVNRMSSAANKRLDRAAKTGTDTPAMKEVRESGGRFSGKGKALEGLKAEFIRLKQFFQNPTSTQKGWEKVQKEADQKARARGVLSGGPTQKGMPVPPPSPVQTGGGEDAAEVQTGAGEIAAEDEGETVGWSHPEGWEWDPDKRSWVHPDYGDGWIPYEGEGGGLIDPITGVIVENTARSIHDYDATEDTRVLPGGGTETGKLWQMVDSISQIDPRFTRRESYTNPAEDPRMQLFNAIDDAWANDPSLSFEAARDLVAGRLDEIYESAQEHVREAQSMSFSTFFSDDDDW